MVYANTSVEYTYPTPSMASSQSTKGRKVPQPHKTTPMPKPQVTKNIMSNGEAHKANETVSVKAPPFKPAPQLTPPLGASPSQPGSKVAVVIPTLPNSFNRNQYTPSHASNHSRHISTDMEAQSPTPAETFHGKTVKPPRSTPTVVQHPPTQVPARPSQSSSSKLGLAVVIPDLPADFRQQDYETVRDSPSTPLHLSRKRKRSENGEDLMRGADRRERAEAALREFRSLLQDILEAEDQLQPNENASNRYFESTEDGPSLTAPIQTKIESMLSKVIEMGVFDKVPLDELLRLQKLCEGSTKQAENVNVRIDSGMGQEDMDGWLHQLPKAEIGLKSARTSLRLMVGGREEKQIYSEDIMQSAIDVFKNITETCIIPIVEMRSTGSSATTFKLLVAHKKELAHLLMSCRRLLAVLSMLAAKIELSETVINTLEFMASRLIFVENAQVEKDSVLGIPKFDILRVVAMDVLAQIFANSPEQRQGIFDEILTSLEKLPLHKQSARQFKLAEGGNIQLVSALIMLLVQSSANKVDDIKEKRRQKALRALNGNEDDDADAGGQPSTTNRSERDVLEERAMEHHHSAIDELQSAVKTLRLAAVNNANYVVSFIVNRAMKSTKSGDAPYRNLLDLFVDDFILCLKSPEWPAAELLLRLLLVKMVHLTIGDKSAVPAKTMALDLLGSMGAAISDLQAHVRVCANALSNPEDWFTCFVRASVNNSASRSDLAAFVGPYRMVSEHLSERCAQEAQLKSAVGFLYTDWANNLVDSYTALVEDQPHQKALEEHGAMAYKLRRMITDHDWVLSTYQFDSNAQGNARLAYATIVLHSSFCGYLRQVLQIHMDCMASDQATVRTKTLKSITPLIERDPAILDREAALKDSIRDRTNDASQLVRESALVLISRCLSLRRSLQDHMLQSILRCVSDLMPNVRKRAMKMSKEIYLLSLSKDIRCAIADSLLHRVTDQEESVRDLARQIIEEIWMSPFYHHTDSAALSVQTKLAMADHVALMISTVQRGSGVATVLEKVIKGMLAKDAKEKATRDKNFRVCKALVTQLFDSFIKNQDNQTKGGQKAREAFQILTIFAKSNFTLFDAEQINLLEPYVANVGGQDDMELFRSMVTIFRHVLPNMSKIHHTFLEAVRKNLQQALSKSGRTVLDDVVACLWIIGDIQDDIRSLTSTVSGLIAAVQRLKAVDFHKQPELVKKLTKQLLICGTYGKHCDLESQYLEFQKKLPQWKDTSVSKLLATTFATFASPSKPLEVRKSALDAIGMVCQSWPKNFAEVAIYTTFQEAFDSKTTVLETIILRAFNSYLMQEEARSETGGQGAAGSASEPAAKLGVMGGSQGDGIAISIAQRFLGHIIRIALATQDDQALLATDVIASISRQGLVHPKEVGATLIALETSQNAAIRDLAFKEHQSLHQKHETILEKEYMRAVQAAYVYQRDIVDDPHGATVNPYTSKLCRLIKVMEISKIKSRKRLYETLCARIDFEPTKMELEDLPNHLQFSQFIIENMAFFDYRTIDELLSALVAMEKVVAGLGTGIAHSIETEILHINLEQPASQVEENGQLQPSQPQTDPIRLQQLNAYSAMLSILWEARTYLRKQYGLMNFRKEGKAKANKDLNRTPFRVQGINGDKFWEAIGVIMSSIDNEETMLAQCKSFVELLTVDHDFKVAAEADDDMDAEASRLETPSEGEEGAPAQTPGTGRGRKRKSVNGGMATPSGRKKRARSSSVPRPRGRPKGSGKKQQSVEHSDGEDWD